MTVPRVLVLGGGGFFGRYVVRDLLTHTDADIVVASRTPHPVGGSQARIGYARCDVHDLATLRPLVATSDLVIHCAGPFQALPLNPLVAAIAARRPYIDLSEGRAFAHQVAALREAIAAAGITVVSGLSIVPALQAMLVELARPRLERVTAIRTFLAPGTRRSRGPAMFHTMLLGVGRRFVQPRRGRHVWVRGWSEGEWATFPAPVGRRLTYLVLDWADLDVLVALYGADTVECKAGCEFAWANRALGLAGAVTERLGWPAWEAWAPLVRSLSWVAGRVGRDDGAVLVEVSGRASGRAVRERLAVVADAEGGRIPAVPAGMGAQEILGGRLQRRGLVPANAWIAPDRFVAGLRERGLRVLRQEPPSSRWREIPGGRT